jgi:hypothetical protein
MELGSMLADKNLTGFDQLATKALHSKTLGIGIATIAGTTATFLMCHLQSSLCNDLVDRDQGVPLTVTLGPAIALAALLLEHSDLVTLQISNEGCLDNRIGYIRGAKLCIVLIHNGENGGVLKSGTGFTLADMINLNGFPFDGLVLLSENLYKCVHVDIHP